LSQDGFDIERACPRHSGILKVTYEHLGELSDYTENLSESGLFISTEHQFDHGQQIEFELSFPGLVKPIRLKGKVVWQRVRESLDDEHPAGIGVCIDFSSEVERTWLKKLIKRFASAGCDTKACETTSQASPVEDNPILPVEDNPILLVEDNPMTSKLFSDAIHEAFGNDDNRFEVTVIDDTGKAWQWIQGNELRLLLIESRMCEEGDFNLLSAIRKLPDGQKKGIPIVVIGGAEENPSASIRQEINVFLRRPVPAKALLRTIRTMFDTSD
jgi:uncharacterized protein (TIGR02266 family)